MAIDRWRINDGEAQEVQLRLS